MQKLVSWIVQSSTKKGDVNLSKSTWTKPVFRSMFSYSWIKSLGLKREKIKIEKWMKIGIY